MTIQSTDTTEIDLSGAGANTRIGYRYADASNYKVFGVAILEGRASDDQIRQMLDTLEDGEFFIPGQVGLRDLQADFQHGAGWDDQDDHVWHRLEAISYTDDEPSEDATSVAHAMAQWPKDRQGWKVAEHYERLSGSLTKVGRLAP